ncbi:MAG: ATP-binding protein [bacterium]
MTSIERNLPGGLLLLAADGTILERPAFLEAWFGTGVESVYELFDPERPCRLALRRVVAGPRHRMEFHVELVEEGARPKFLRYWDLTPADAEVATFFLVDDTSVVESYFWQEQRVRRGLLEDIRGLLASHMRPAITTLGALADVIHSQPKARREAITRYGEVADLLASAVRGVDNAIHAQHSVDSEIPFRVVDLASVLSSYSDSQTAVDCQVVDIQRDVFVSSSAVEHVLIPVLENALEAHPKDGWVHVTVTLLPSGKVCIEVQDSGRGMTKHELERAQDPFFTTKRGHSGYGLAGAGQVLSKLGGYWNFSSARRKGTRVRICVPRLDAEGGVATDQT